MMKHVIISIAIAFFAAFVSGCTKSTDDEPATEQYTYSKILGTWAIDANEWFTFGHGTFTHDHDGTTDAGKYGFNPEANALGGTYDDGRALTIEMAFQDATHATFTINRTRVALATKTK